jgi:stage II sporulation protein D
MWSYLQVLRISIIRYILVILLLSIALMPWSGTGNTNAAVLDETIRIAILKSAPEVTVAGDGLLITGDTGKAVVFSLPVTVKPFKEGLTAEGKFFRGLKFSASSVLFINNKPYRGLAELSYSEKGVLVINQLPLEEYLVGLINCEISSAWPIEAVKAQAVIARTYALHRKAVRAKALYHMESTVIDQVYDGSLIEDSRASRAVSETSGEVLLYGGAVIQAYYHSSCGGKTEAAENVWGASLPYLKGVDCQYCLASSSASASAWEQKLPLTEIEERLRAAGNRLSGLTDINTGVLNSRGRLKQVILVASKGSFSLTGDQFRKAVGYGVIKSTRFTVKISQGEAVFSGTGNGHGVGLCQWGAKQRSIDGFGYGEILAYYYPGTELKKFSEIR